MFRPVRILVVKQAQEKSKENRLRVKWTISDRALQGMAMLKCLSSLDVREVVVTEFFTLLCQTLICTFDYISNYLRNLTRD